jgi:hypothetical protein
VFVKRAVEQLHAYLAATGYTNSMDKENQVFSLDFIKDITRQYIFVVSLALVVDRSASWYPLCIWMIMILGDFIKKDGYDSYSDKHLA